MNSRILFPVLTLIAFATGMAVTGAVLAPDDVWPNVLVSGLFLTGIGLAGGFVVAVHDLSGAHWLGPLRRIACSFTRLVLPGAAVVLVAILFGGSHLYPAFHEHLPGFKGVWLGRTFFTLRAFGYAAAWAVALRLLHKKRASAFYIVVFGFTVWLSGVDWVMSLEPHWSSTIFGVYHFAGLVTAGLAAIIIVAVHRSRTDSAITSDHLHDLAKLLFAFSTFWMYIWFSQSMLIWYGNMHEETGYYLLRAYGNWGVLFWTTVALMWVIPFFVLLPETTKRNRTILTRIAIVILVGHWLDLYVSVVPAISPDARLTGWELALALGTFAAVGLAATRRERDLEEAVVVLDLAR